MCIYLAREFLFDLCQILSLTDVLCTYHSQLYKVLFPYTPTKDDELELSDGDYVYVHASDSGHTG